MMLADFQPGLFFLLLWGLISWLTRNKKKKISPDNGEVETKPKSKEDLFARLQKLQEHLSTEVKIFPESPRSMEAEDDYSDEMDESGFEEPEIPVQKLADVYEEDECVFETDIKVSIAGQNNWLKKNLSQKSNLRKLMVLREILGEPRSLKPYTRDFFQS